MATIRIRHLKMDGHPVRCPGRGPGDVPRELSLMPSGEGVMATCGSKHRGPDGGKTKCFWRLTGMDAAELEALAGQARPGPIRAEFPAGVVLEGTVTKVGEADAKSSSTKAGGRRPAAAAMAKKNPKTKAKTAGPQTPKAARKNAGGGTAKAAFTAIAAVAGAVGQTATAASNAVSSTAGMVGTVAKAGASTTQAAITAADNVGARRFAARNTRTDEDAPLQTDARRQARAARENAVRQHTWDGS